MLKLPDLSITNLQITPGEFINYGAHVGLDHNGKLAKMQPGQPGYLGCLPHDATVHDQCWINVPEDWLMRVRAWQAPSEEAASRPLTPLAPANDLPAWQQIDALFVQNGLARPGSRLRDELVNHLLWARYAETLHRRLAEPQEKSMSNIKHVVDLLWHYKQGTGTHVAFVPVDDLPGVNLHYLDYKRTAIFLRENDVKTVRATMHNFWDETTLNREQSPGRHGTLFGMPVFVVPDIERSELVSFPAELFQ